MNRLFPASLSSYMLLAQIFFYQTYILMYNRCQNQISLVPDRHWIIGSAPVGVGELGKAFFHIISTIHCADFPNNNRNFPF